ncbi:MAG: DUF494 domain-containing protein [Gammaproteobacteria bacterium]|nr:MAG: DUF494 domain-containing protein [Gammaproteobacteria bacterium]
MKENILDVLMYLLQNAPIDEEIAAHDQESLQHMLIKAGFEKRNIHQAFRWLEDLDLQISNQQRIEHNNPAARCFSGREKQLLDVQCRDYLLRLVNNGILSLNSFELVMDRVLALSGQEVSLDQLEWIILVVLSNQSEEQAAFDRMEAMLFSDYPVHLH